VGTTFICEVVLQKQAESPTYRVQNNLDELSENCKKAIVITDKETSQKPWISLLRSLQIQHVEAMNFSDFVIYYEELERKNDLPSVLIIDEDFTMMDDLSPQKQTSEEVLEVLQQKFKGIAEVPTLYITDIRSRSSTKTGDSSASTIQHIRSSANVTTFDDTLYKFNFTSERCLSMCKPYKNSKLIAALHRLMDTQIMKRKESVELESPGALEHANDSPKFLDQRSHSFSSTSSGRPLADFLSSINSLLVDDNPINVKVMMRMLTRMGLNPQTAQNGREACDLLMASREKGEPIDLIFMDIWMPEMNGLEASQHIRQSLTHSSLRPYIIAMTACVMPGDREKCMAAGKFSNNNKKKSQEIMF
jgi:CheY-like chemotaxis protein